MVTMQRLPEDLGQPQHGTGPFRMKMNHVIVSKVRTNRSGNEGCHGSKCFFIYGWHGFDSDSLIFSPNRAVKLFGADMVAPSVIAGYVTALAHHSDAQFIDYDLHTAFPGWNALVVQHRDFHFLNPYNFQSFFVSSKVPMIPGDILFD